MIETNALALWLHERTKERRDAAALEYMDLCRRAAARHARTREEHDDLCQVATVGLLKALDRYRIEADVPFAPYAWAMIEGEVRHYLRDAVRTVRLPRKIGKLYKRWCAA